MFLCIHIYYMDNDGRPIKLVSTHIPEVPSIAQGLKSALGWLIEQAVYSFFVTILANSS